MKNENQVLLLCGPAVPDRRRIGRLLCRIDTGFRYFQAKPIDELRTNGNGHNGHAETLDNIGDGAYKHGFIFYISRFDECYAIRSLEIENCLLRRKTPVIEWPLARLHYISSLLPVFTVLLMPDDRERMIQNLREEYKATEEKIMEFMLEYEEYSQVMNLSDLVVRYNANNLMHAVEKIQAVFRTELNR